MSAAKKSTVTGALTRPRSQRVHERMLDAAIELFAERGIAGTSMDAIVAKSGVSKATIYKHWADKTALCLEALGRVHGLDRPRPVFHSGNLKQDFLDFLKHQPPAEFSDVRTRLMPHMIAYAAQDREFGRVWRAHVMEPGRAVMIGLLERGVREGTLRADLDFRICLALLIGPMMYQHVFRDTAAVPEHLAEGVVDAFWRAFANQARGA